MNVKPAVATATPMSPLATLTIPSAGNSLEVMFHETPISSLKYPEVFLN
jgi:hypothetical protein